MTGLHAEDCTCARCEAGYRPTIAQRWAARQAHERAKKRQALTEQLSEAQIVRREAKAALARQRLAAEEAETTARLRAQAAAVKRAWKPSAEEIAEMRRENGLPPPRKGNHR
jgi:hypothetical protein